MLGVYVSHLRRGSIANLCWCSKVVNDMNENILVSVHGYWIHRKHFFFFVKNEEPYFKIVICKFQISVC